MDPRQDRSKAGRWRAAAAWGTATSSRPRGPGEQRLGGGRRRLGWRARLEEGGSAWGGERLALAGGSRLERSSPEEARARVEGSSPEEARATLAGNAGTSGCRSVAEGGGDASGEREGGRMSHAGGGSGKEGGGAAPPPVAAPLPGRETEPRLLVGNGSSERVRKEKGTEGYHCLFMLVSFLFFLFF